MRTREALVGPLAEIGRLHARETVLLLIDGLEVSVQIDIFPDNFFKEAAPVKWAIPNLSEGKFRLQYR